MLKISSNLLHRLVHTKAATFPLTGVKNVVLVSSAKGGVGKSTVAVNLALAMKSKTKQEHIGLLDADVFGPSVPKMMGLEGMQPEVDENKRIIPIVNYEIKCMSIGFLIDSQAAVVWRGLMVMSAIQQLLRQVLWGPLHTLVIDMPPGTGDVQLSICQNVPVQGALVITTPQAVATSDAQRGLNMLQKLKVPIYGIVENMSGYKCPACGHREALFGDSDEENTISGGVLLAKIANVPLLCRIPIDPRLVKTGDSGRPLLISYPESETAQIYHKLADSLLLYMHTKKMKDK